MFRARCTREDAIMLARRNFAILGVGISVSAPEVTVHLVKIRKGLTSDHQVSPSDERCTRKRGRPSTGIIFPPKP
jgi:hypothetical protein